MTSRSRKRKSANSSGSPELPSAFIDRSLGKYEIAGGLREAGFGVQTLAEVFSEDRGQRTPDPEWIAYAAHNGLVIFTKDDDLLVDHLDVIHEVKAKLFVLPRADLSGHEQVARYVKHRFRIAQRSRKPGPLAFRLYPLTMAVVHLGDPSSATT